MEEKRRNLLVGHIVSIKVDNTPKTKRPLGLIIEVSPDPKETVRSVILKTKESKTRRPITKFCLLIPCDWTDYGMCRTGKMKMTTNVTQKAGATQEELS